MIARRRAFARRYQELLADVPGLRTVTDPAHGTTNYQSFWVLLEESFPVNRDELLAELAAHGVSARRGIMASHLEPAYAAVPVAASALDDTVVLGQVLPVTERLSRDSLILPLFHTMTQEQQDHVVGVLRRAASGA